MEKPRLQIPGRTIIIVLVMIGSVISGTNAGAQQAADTGRGVVPEQMVLHSGLRLSGGFSFPILDFNSSTMTGGGFAQLGGIAMAEYIRETSPNLDVGLLAAVSVNPFNNAEFKSLSGYGAGDETNVSPWMSYTLCATAGYGSYSWNGAFAHVHGGILVLTAPEVLHSNIFAHSTTTIYPRTTGTGFAYGVSAGLSFGRVIFGGFFLTSDVGLGGWGATVNNGLHESYRQSVFLAGIVAGFTIP